MRYRNYPLLIGSVISGLFLLLAVIGPTVAPYAPDYWASRFISAPDGNPLFPPYAPLVHPDHPLGTDDFGRDILSRILWGIRPTLLLCVVIVLARVVSGALLGLLAGWRGGLIEHSLELIISVVIAIPTLIIAIAAIFLLGLDRGLPTFVLGLSLLGWADTAIYVHAQTRLIKQAPYIESARALGLGSRAILQRHVLPQILPVLPMLFAYELAAVALLLAELGFLGIFIGGGFVYADDVAGRDVLQLMVGYPELGQMLSSFWRKVWRAPWEQLFVGGTLFMMIFGFNMLGEGLRRAIDVTRPRSVWGRLRAWGERRKASSELGRNASGKRRAAAAAGLAALALLVLVLWPTRRHDERVAQPAAHADETPLVVAQATVPSPTVANTTESLNPTPTADDGPSFPTSVNGPGRLFISTRGRELTPLNPVTLAPDRKTFTAASIDIGAPSVVAAAGGTRLAVVDGTNAPNTDYIAIVDTRTAKEEARHHLDFNRGTVFFSADGSRLLVHHSNGFRRRGSDLWHLVDADNGRTISSLYLSNYSPNVDATWIGPAGHRFYVLREPVSDAGSWVLTAYDLDAGREAGRLVLKSIQACGTSDEMAAIERKWPGGLALSPDGTRFALLHSACPALTLVDAQRMEVVQTVPITGLGPDASGDGWATTSWSVTFAPDGRAVYGVGEALQRTATGITAQPMGIFAIDVESGQVSAHGLPDTQIEHVRVAFDGSALYVLVHTVDAQSDAKYLLRRLGGTNLQVTAEVALSSHVLIYLFVPLEE